MFGFGAIWQWAVACNALAFYLVFRPSYRRLELVFFVFLAVLSASFLGCAVWVGFNPADVARGLVRMEMPGQHGAFDPWQVALAMIGAVGGSLMNLVYPYFLDEKGWRGPQYRRVQFYDFLLGVIAMFVLNLSIWVLGAELLYPDKHIGTLDDLPNLLSTMLGNSGRLLFYAGIFSAIYTSIIGHAAGLGRLGTHAWLRWTTPSGPISGDYRSSPVLPLDCGLVPRHAARLDDARDAGLRGADARGEQRAGRAAAAARGRAVVDHGERAPDRARAPKPVVGERAHGSAVRPRHLLRGAGPRRSAGTITKVVPDVVPWSHASDSLQIDPPEDEATRTVAMWRRPT